MKEMTFFKSIKTTLWALGLCLLGFSANAENSIQGDGKIRLYNYHLDEFLEIQFKKSGQIDPASVDKINQLLRSRDNSESIQINALLLDWMDHLQDHFAADTIEIISGYRRKEFNDSLLKSGHSVSPVSLHTQGKAIDIHIDEIREETLRDYLLSLQLGGVGYYAQLDFVHMDSGPVRRWGGGPSARKLVGVLDENAAVQLTSDQNDYLPNQTIRWRWDFSKGSHENQIKDLKLQHFWRGKWEDCSTPLKAGNPFTFSLETISCTQSGPGKKYGKYRIVYRIEDNPKLLSSNEFYLKKL